LASRVMQWVAKASITEVFGQPVNLEIWPADHCFSMKKAIKRAAFSHGLDRKWLMNIDR
jgi:hypothetical protein